MPGCKVDLQRVCVCSSKFNQFFLPSFLVSLKGVIPIGKNLGVGEVLGVNIKKYVCPVVVKNVGVMDSIDGIYTHSEIIPSLSL